MQLIQTKSNRGLPNGMVVIGLATSHNQEMKQVRGVDQTPYQSWHSPLRWATSYAHEVAPLLEVKFDVQNHENQKTVWSFTSLQMFHTHTFFELAYRAYRHTIYTYVCWGLLGYGSYKLFFFNGLISEIIKLQYILLRSMPRRPVKVTVGPVGDEIWAFTGQSALRTIESLRRRILLLEWGSMGHRVNDKFSNLK